MLKSLHHRVFKEVADVNFQSAFMDYYNNRGEFRPEFMSQAEWKAIAEAEASFCDHMYLVC